MFLVKEKISKKYFFLPKTNKARNFQNYLQIERKRILTVIYFEIILNNIFFIFILLLYFFYVEMSILNDMRFDCP